VSEKLPGVARARMAAIRASGTWGSALTADEFAAIRGVGFEPVGQVFGAAVYSVGYTGYSCPGTWRSDGDQMPSGPATQVSGENGPGSFGPLVQAMYQARRAAIDRMTAECTELGGHGPRVPFTCDLSGQDFAKLIMKGWVPAGLVLGISIGSRHDDRNTARQTRRWSGNAEVAGWTELVGESRHDARRQLESDVTRFGAEGVVIATMQMRVRERDCPVQVGRRDHIVESTVIGTAIARFSPGRPRHAQPALAVMSLDPQRRRAARIRILRRRASGPRPLLSWQYGRGQGGHGGMD